MKVFCRNLVAFVLLGTSAEIKAQPRSPNAPRPIAPRKPAAPAPKPVPIKPAAPAPKPVPIKPAAPAPKPVPSKPAAPVPKPVAPVPKPVPSKPAAAAVPKPAAPVPKPVPSKPAAAAVPKPAAPSPGSSCPVIAPYTKPPTAQCGTCYRDMSALTKFLNSTSKVVSATICSGTYAMPATAAFDNSNITSLTLSCCGDARSCIIDGGAASSTPVARTKRLFTFNQAIILDIQGIRFQNFDCSDSYCEGGLLYTESAALVTFKHNYVSKVKSYNYGALGFDDGTFLVFESNTFSDNSAVNANSYSAGVYIDDSTVFMNGNFFFRNTAWVGGALYFEDSHVEAFCNKFEGNQALKDVEFNHCYGGAISLEDSSLDAKFNQFINNTATGGSGGAIYSEASQLYFTSNNFSFNTADYGGAVYGEGSGIVTNADSFAKNAATTGNNTALYNAVMKTCPGTLVDVFVDPYSITVVQCV